VAIAKARGWRVPTSCRKPACPSPNAGREDEVTLAEGDLDRSLPDLGTNCRRLPSFPGDFIRRVGDAYADLLNDVSLGILDELRTHIAIID